MTDTSIPVGPAGISSPPAQIVTGAKNWFKAAMYSMQYAQMIRAMNMLPDDVLKEMGVKRSEIRQHCEKLLD